MTAFRQWYVGERNLAKVPSCPRCEDTGNVEQCDADGSRCWLMACDCEHGDRWAESQAHLHDDHERAAARARGNDFEDTDGRDWT